MVIRVVSLLAVLILLAGCGMYASPPGQQRGTTMDIATRCELLARDVATTLDLPWAIRDLDGAIWSTTERPDGLDYLDRFDPDEAVVIVDGTVKVLDGDTLDEIVTDAADDVATEIMDRLNRPWPETAAVAVLEINMVDGEIFWCVDSQPACRLGDLHTLALRSASGR